MLLGSLLLQLLAGLNTAQEVVVVTQVPAVSRSHGSRVSCGRDADCSLTAACIEAECADPCVTTPCPMQGGICKVVGHRPVCSCPSGTQNINSSCTSDTSCQWGPGTQRLGSGEHYYEPSCEQRCECKDGEFICQPTTCQDGLTPKGQLNKEDGDCEERSHPAGDECCVLWVCRDPDPGPATQLPTPSCDPASCGDHGSCDPATASCSCDPGYTRGSSGACEQLADWDPEDNIRLLQITATSIQVQFPDITGGNLMYIETKRLENKREPAWENAILVEGNEIFTLTDLSPDTAYTLRWKAPDRQYPDVEASTLAVETDQRPKVLMTNRTHEAASLSFDPFSPPGYSHGYVAQWRKVNQSVWSMDEKESTGADTPTIVIDGLEPDTEYVAKISVYADFTNRVLGDTTEEISFRTLAGCLHQNTSYPVGGFTLDCDTACECAEDGGVECGARCRGPHHRRGQFQDDPLCVERPVDEDGCCVLVLCAAAEEGDDSLCGETACGPNAECRREVARDTDSVDNTICVCREGYTGHPDSDEGCSLSNTRDLQPDTDACITPNATYQPGQTWFDGCDYTCSCNNKEILCEPRCKIITENVAAACQLKPDPADACCQTMVCPEDEAGAAQLSDASVRQPSLPSDGCQFKNSTYAREERWYDGCDQQCQCMGFGDVFCLPRCQPTKPGLGEDCYTLPDVTDSCCNVTVCDQPKHEVPDVVKIPAAAAAVSEKQPRRIEDPAAEEAVYVGPLVEQHHGVAGEVWLHNETTLVVRNFSYDGEGVDVYFWAATEDAADGAGVILPHPFTGIFYAPDAKDAPVLAAADKETVTLVLPPDLALTEVKWLSVFSRQFGIVYASVRLPEAEEEDSATEAAETVPVTALPQTAAAEGGCVVGGAVHGRGEEWYDGCARYCVCAEGGEAVCLDIECPSEFGLDVINPNCIQWDKHDTFVPAAPTCCPPVPVCLSDGSCEYRGQNFTNYDSIPAEVTGCEQRCHCEDGEVRCRDACYQISERPPSWLPCDPSLAVHVPNPDRECCLIWGCGDPPFAPPDELLGAAAAAVNDTCISVSFDLPPSVGGLAGWYSVSYSTLAAGHPDAARWPAQKVEVPGGKIPDPALDAASERGAAVICSLVPNVDYLFRPALVLAEHADQPVTGEIVTGRTAAAASTTLAPGCGVVYLDMELAATAVTTTSARISWRPFHEEEEKPHIDGVQLRHIVLRHGIPVSHVPSTSPFIHRDTNYFRLEGLAPSTEYEVELDLIPVPGTCREQFSGRVLQLTTPPQVDPYNFAPVLSVLNTSAHSVEVGWTGVPSPDQKFVNIYRVIYHSLGSEVAREESSVFKISKIDSPKRLVVTGLEAALRYQVWLESYLTNGKIVKSNVEEFTTLASSAPPSSLPTSQADTSDYYQSMVAASIIAALAILVLVVILYFYLKRHTTYKATITKEPPTTINGNTAVSYDNPAFKGYESDGNLNQTIPPGSSFELGPLSSD